MPSISDTLHIASQAIENALTATSTKRVGATTSLSGTHNHKKREAVRADDKSENDPFDQIGNTVTKHIDLRI